MPFDPEDALFLLPGPVRMHPRVLRALARPAMGHRSPEFQQANRRLFDGLRRLAGTPHVAALAGTGTAGMEAAVSNLVHWGDRAVGLDNGRFGARMAELVGRAAGDRAVRIASAWGGGVDLPALERALEEGAGAVAFTLNETSTGVMNQGADIGRLCRRHGALAIADTVTATGGVPVPMQQWGLDACVFASQKCLGGPSGLVFVALSDRAVARLDSPSLYFDLRRHLEKAAEGATPFTAAVPLHLACAEALDLLFEEGLERRFARTRRLAEGCRAAAEAAGVELAAQAGVRSDTVTALRLPDGVTDAQVRGVLRDRFGVVVGGGQGDWKGKVVRLSHMAHASWTELAAAWCAIEAALRLAGRPVRPGAAAAALLDHLP